MALQTDSAAVKIARAHAQAWSTHDFDAAESGLGADVRSIVTTTQPFPPAIDTTGVEEYMSGLRQFVAALKPGSLKEVAAIGDDQNALLMITVEGDFGGGPVTLPGARLYAVDEAGKITAEHVIFFVGS